MASPYAIGGSIGGGMIGPFSAYCTYYQNAMSSYNNVMQGYQNLAQAQYAAEAPITAGYQNLYNTVLGGISGVETSQLQAIQCQYTKANASTQQQMINAGLGNSTVLASLQRGVCSQKSLATTQAQNQFAQLQAGYESQLGLAGLNWQQQALGMNTALGVQQLKCMMIPLPNPSGFMAQYQNMFGAKPTGGGAVMPPMPRGAAIPPKGNMPGCNPYGGGFGGGGGMFCYGGGGGGQGESLGCNPYSGSLGGGIGAAVQGMSSLCTGAYG